MDFDKVLELVEPHWHDDFRSFIETGVASDEFAAYVNADIFCQTALDITIDFEYRTLSELEHRRQVLAVLRVMDPRWHREFLALSMRGEHADDDFVEYINHDERCYEAMERYYRFISSLDAEDGQGQNQSSPSSPFEHYARELESLRQRWMNEDLGP